MQGYDNLRAFILYRDDHTCQICKKKKGILNIHHIITRKDGGSDRPDNLVTVHKNCHEDFHAGKIKHQFTKPKSFKQTPMMNNIRKYVVDLLGCNYTYGYITKRIRLDLGLEKSHINDAFVIAQGVTQTRQVPYIVKQARRNNRCLQINRNGYRPSIRRQRHPFQPGDIVRCEKVFQEVKTTYSYGKYVRLIDKSKKSTNARVKNIKLLKYGKGLQFREKQLN